MLPLIIIYLKKGQAGLLITFVELIVSLVQCPVFELRLEGSEAWCAKHFPRAHRERRGHIPPGVVRLRETFILVLYNSVFVCVLPPPHTAYIPVTRSFPSMCVEQASHHCQCNFPKLDFIYWGSLYISVRGKNLHWTLTAYTCDYLTWSKHCYLERWSTLTISLAVFHGIPHNPQK